MNQFNDKHHDADSPVLLSRRKKIICRTLTLLLSPIDKRTCWAALHMLLLGSAGERSTAQDLRTGLFSFVSKRGRGVEEGNEMNPFSSEGWTRRARALVRASLETASFPCRLRVRCACVCPPARGCTVNVTKRNGTTRLRKQAQDGMKRVANGLLIILVVFLRSRFCLFPLLMVCG